MLGSRAQSLESCVLNPELSGLLSRQRRANLDRMAIDITHPVGGKAHSSLPIISVLMVQVTYGLPGRGGDVHQVAHSQYTEIHLDVSNEAFCILPSTTLRYCQMSWMES